MASGSTRTALLKHLYTLYRVGVIGDLTDGQLLERFVIGRDGAAEAVFSALVERHGPMVLRVCQQVLGNSHDADDAFQATFLVLASKAGAIRRRDSVASWLYGVAQRVAMRAKADATRRRRHERRGATRATAHPRGDEGRPESWLELHEEIARLPEKYRAAVVLCYLEGLTTEVAAQRLGCPQGTVLSRLSRARNLLRARLTRRGLGLTAGLLAAELMPKAAPAAVPAVLGCSTVQAARHVTAGQAVTEVVSAAVAAWVEGVMRTMLMIKLKTVAGALLVVGLVVTGMGGLAQQEPEAERQAAHEVAAPRMKYEIRIWKNGEATGKPIVVEEADGAELSITTPNERILISPRPQPVPGPVTIGRVKPLALRGQAPPEAVLVAPAPATEQERRLAEVEQKLDQLLKGTGPGVAPLVPRGMRAFTIPMSSVGLILPGNKVDVLLTSQGKSGPLTTTLLENVKILAVDPRIDGPAENRVDPNRMRWVTLLVTPDQAAKLDLGQNTGTLHLSLRGSEADQPADSRP